MLIVGNVELLRGWVTSNKNNVVCKLFPISIGIWKVNKLARGSFGRL